MDRHLSFEQVLALVDIDGPIEDRHASRCEDCRLEVESLRSVRRRVQGTAVPEPSPLFWDFLSRRIHDAVAEDEPVLQPGRSWARWLAAAVPLTAAIALALAVTTPSRVDPTLLAPESGVVQDGAADAPEPEWVFLEGLLESAVDASDGSLVDIDVGDAERLVADLDASEQAALLRVLERELRPSR